MTNYRFSLFRLFMAVTVYCGAFGFVKAIGASWPICPWLIGVPMALLIMVVKPKNKKDILHGLKVCGIGVVTGQFLLFLSATQVPEEYTPLEAYPTAALLGVLLVCLLRYFLIAFANWHYDIRHSYWDQYDSTTNASEDDDVNQSEQRELIYDQAGTEAD